MVIPQGKNALLTLFEQQIIGQGLMRIHCRAHVLAIHLKLIVCGGPKKAGSMYDCLDALTLATQHNVGRPKTNTAITGMFGPRCHRKTVALKAYRSVFCLNVQKIAHAKK